MEAARSDADLIHASLATPEVFGIVFERHYDVVRRYLQRRSGLEMGEELAARTFEEAFRTRGGFNQAYASARPWLLGIGTNLLRNALRSERVQLRAVARASGLRPIGPRGIERAEERLDAERHLPALVDALMTLEDRDRDTLLLFAWNDLTYDDIAVALDVPVGTVRSRLNRARRQLRELLGPQIAIDGGEDE